MSTFPDVDFAFAERTLLGLLALGGPSGQEGAVARRLTELLVAECGVAPGWITHDDAHRRLPGYTVGNLVVRVPGTVPGPGRLFSTHMDTVPLCAGAVPKVDGGRVVPAGETALGGDDRTGCAALVSMLHTLHARKMAHPPLVVLFTVGEEAGLLGAREADPSVFAGIDMGFNVDGGAAAEMVRGAIGMQVWRAEIHGRSSHAGVYPGRGISAIAIAASLSPTSSGPVGSARSPMRADVARATSA